MILSNALSLTAVLLTSVTAQDLRLHDAATAHEPIERDIGSWILSMDVTWGTENCNNSTQKRYYLSMNDGACIHAPNGDLDDVKFVQFSIYNWKWGGALPAPEDPQRFFLHTSSTGDCSTAPPDRNPVVAERFIWDQPNFRYYRSECTGVDHALKGFLVPEPAKKKDAKHASEDEL